MPLGGVFFDYMALRSYHINKWRRHMHIHSKTVKPNTSVTPTHRHYRHLWLRLTQSVQHKEESHNVDRLTLMDAAWQWRKTIRSTLLHLLSSLFTMRMKRSMDLEQKKSPLFYPLVLSTWMVWSQKRWVVFLIYPSRAKHIPQKWHFEDDFPFPKVGYVSSLEGKTSEKWP